MVGPTEHSIGADSGTRPDATSPKSMRVLVVDDSALVRRILTQVLESIPGVEVAGTAANGVVALTRVAELRPDLVLLDVEMPELDGLGTLRELRRLSIHIPVIMCSTLTSRGAAVTLEALTSGAVDYVTKPSNTGSLAASVEQLRSELGPKILAFRRPHPLPSPVILRGNSPRADTSTQGPFTSAGRVRAATGGTRLRVPQLLLIGSSTGGPDAIQRVFAALPKLPVPVLVAQHMPPVFTELFARRLNTTSPMDIAEAADGEWVAGGQCRIAPGDHHLEVVEWSQTRGIRLRLNQGPKVHSCRPAVDVLFSSVGAAAVPDPLAVVLTGMGRDGADGAGEVLAAGGQVIAQDEASSVVWGMPGATVAAGHATRVLPLSDIPEALAAACRVVR